MSLFCYENLLTTLKLTNGNNISLLTVFAQDNLNLRCIEVDDVDLSNANINWLKDVNASYSTNFGVLGGNEVEKELEFICYSNPANNFLKIKAPLGVEIKGIKIYDIRGKLEMKEKKRFEALYVSKLNEGIFLVIIETHNYSITKKMLKK